MKPMAILLLASSLLFVGCMKDTEVKEFDKSALYWYEELAKSIANENMDRADSLYISLKSEHLRSPLMETAVLMLAHAHIEEENYLLANHYLDEHHKRFAHKGSREYIDFMKLKASFLGIKEVYKDQKLMMDSIVDAKRFKSRYPSSRYVPLVDTILVKLYMSQYLLNENIASLYNRKGKPEAAKIYREKNRDSMVNMTDITPPPQGIMGQIFD
jgi:outer membrane protein assembly factor BamD